MLSRLYFFCLKPPLNINQRVFLFPTQQNPFGTASSLSADERLQAQNQSVCTLRAFLDLAAQYGKLVIFDLYRPPRGHPYRDAWISRTLDVIQNESSIHSSQVCHYIVAFWESLKGDFCVDSRLYMFIAFLPRYCGCLHSSGSLYKKSTLIYNRQQANKHQWRNLSSDT